MRENLENAERLFKDLNRTLKPIPYGNDYYSFSVQPDPRKKRLYDMITSEVNLGGGGFYILLHLRKKTGVAFQPYHMDIETLQRYETYTKPLTEHDKSRLKKLLGGEFGETVAYMLEHNCKLEQEALD